MDCDYTPEKAAQAKIMKLQAREKRKKNKKRSFADMENASSAEKEQIPVYNKQLHKTFQNYLDEYYSLECEDFIDDMPCRFKYKEVIPNSFGLTVEEILAADDNELNKWCPMKNISVIRSEKVEKFDIKAYKHKATDDQKKRILPSLFISEENIEEGEEVQNKKKKKKKKKKNNLTTINENVDTENGIVDTENGIVDVDTENVFVESDDDAEVKQNKRKVVALEEGLVSDTTDKIGEERPLVKKVKMDINQGKTSFSEQSSAKQFNKKNHEQKIIKKQFPGKYSGHDNRFSKKSRPDKIKKQKVSSNKREMNNSKKVEPDNDITDIRLKAYGIKPKQFRNKMKYKEHK